MEDMPMKYSVRPMLSWMVIASFVVCTSIAAAASERRVDEKCKASPDGVVEISNAAGSVRVIGWDREEVTVTGTVPENAKLDFEGGEKRTTVKVNLPKLGLGAREADLEVHVPSASRLEAETVSATLDVTGVRGVLELKSVSGNVAAAGDPEDVEARTVSGKLEISVSSRHVEAEAVSGEIRLQGAAGKVRVSNVSGSSIISADNLKDGSLESVSGNIRFEGIIDPAGRLDVQTVSGDIEALMPAGIAAVFEVSTFSGGIQNDFGQALAKTEKNGPGKELKFTTGSGAARISLQSFSGDVILKKK
jgi:DUF4097 and DUF4098 domain-containing protein YvlB